MPVLTHERKINICLIGNSASAMDLLLKRYIDGADPTVKYIDMSGKYSQWYGVDFSSRDEYPFKFKINAVSRLCLQREDDHTLPTLRDAFFIVFDASQKFDGDAMKFYLDEIKRGIGDETKPIFLIGVTSDKSALIYPAKSFAIDNGIEFAGIVTCKVDDPSVKCFSDSIKTVAEKHISVKDVIGQVIKDYQNKYKVYARNQPRFFMRNKGYMRACFYRALLQSERLPIAVNNIILYALLATNNGLHLKAAVAKELGFEGETDKQKIQIAMDSLRNKLRECFPDACDKEDGTTGRLNDEVLGPLVKMAERYNGDESDIETAVAKLTQFLGVDRAESAVTMSTA